MTLSKIRKENLISLAIINYGTKNKPEIIRTTEGTKNAYDFQSIIEVILEMERDGTIKFLDQ